MKTSLGGARLRMIGTATLAGALIALAVGSSSTRAQTSDGTCGDSHCMQRQDPALGGTWEVMVALVNCQTGATIGQPFPSLLTFAGNGTMVETTHNPSFAIGQREPGVGVWSRSGPRTYYARSEAFIQFTTAPAPPTSPGFLAGTQTIAQTIVFDADPDHWTSDAQIQFADNSGSVYRQGCAQAAAQRFQ